MRRLVAVVLFLVPMLASGKSYRYPEIRTEVRLLVNSDARVIQDRTYRFIGPFSWAFVDLKTNGSGGIELNSVLERSGNEWVEPARLLVEERTHSLYARWEYSAQDEEKTFRLDYLVKDVVKRYQDVAEFFWKVIEDEHEPIDHIETEVVLPGSSAELLKVYVHSRARPGEMEFAPGKDRVLVLQEGVPRNAFVEFRVLAEPELFTEAALIQEMAYARILGEEKRNYLFSALRTHVLVPVGLLLAVVVPILLAFLFYFRYGREPKIEYDAVYEHEPPRLAPPVAVPAVLAQKPDSAARNSLVFQGVFATLLQLAGKGLIAVEELKQGRSTDYRFSLSNPDRVSELEPLGREIVRFLFGKVAAGAGSFTDRQFRDYGKRHASEVRSWLGELYDSAKSWWEAKLGGGLLDPDSTQAWRNCLVYVWLAEIAAAVLLGIGLSGFLPGVGPLVWVIGFGLCLVLGVVFSLASRPILRWSESAHLEHRRWKTFRKFLVEFSAIEQAPIKLLPIWEQYYVYAVVLGVAKQFLQNLDRLALQQGAELRTPVWFAAGAGAGSFGSFQQAMGSLNSLSSNFSGIMSSFSPSSSTGGGFSGGGGGGGGGGSSGAG